MSNEDFYLILFYIALMNVISFTLFGIDKAKAKRHAWRIPESALMMSALLSGAFGAMLGMHVFRHKTKHALFTAGIPLAAVLWLGVIAFLTVRML